MGEMDPREKRENQVEDRPIHFLKPLPQQEKCPLWGIWHRDRRRLTFHYGGCLWKGILSKDASLALQGSSLPPWNWRCMVVLREGVSCLLRELPQDTPSPGCRRIFLPWVTTSWVAVSWCWSTIELLEKENERQLPHHISFIFPQGKGSEAHRALQGKWGLQEI